MNTYLLGCFLAYTSLCDLIYRETIFAVHIELHASQFFILIEVTGIEFHTWKASSHKHWTSPSFPIVWPPTPDFLKSS